ncbi:MAG: cytochrome c3 family protein [Candidatus Zixiibacteriota bacterium]
MIGFFKELWSILVRHGKGLTIFISACVVVIVAALLFFSYETTQSSFCDSCHYMDPYVRHWQASSHAGVDCVACHDYGALDLAVSTFKYWTNTYDSRPKAVVPDENCLSSDCHDHETLDVAQQFRKGITFQHNVHLGKELRGGKLRCTSCHNQIVQYDDEVQGHMAVNDKSCFVCHFKDAGMGEAITGCNSCHGMPEKQVEHAGFVFDHEPYLKLGVECKQCHVQIVKGDGSVAESKCYSCHVERSPQQISRAQLHDIHVTEQGIDCYKCHSDIEHGNFRMASALEIECESCHLRQHNAPKQMYMGIGGKDSVDMPSEMFTAQVSCTGCHTHVTPEGEILAHQEKKEASRKSCVTCHGEGYDLMFDNWLEGSKKVLAEYAEFLSSARSDYNNAGGGKSARQKARVALDKSQENYNFVREGHIPHNIRYALYLLNSSTDDFETAMKQINKGYSAPSRGASLRAENTCLTFCHGKSLNPEWVMYDQRELPHRMHVAEFGLGCESCHSVTEHGKTKIEQSVCADCH